MGRTFHRQRKTFLAGPFIDKERHFGQDLSSTKKENSDKASCQKAVMEILKAELLLLTAFALDIVRTTTEYSTNAFERLLLFYSDVLWLLLLFSCSCLSLCFLFVCLFVCLYLFRCCSFCCCCCCFSCLFSGLRTLLFHESSLALTFKNSFFLSFFLLGFTKTSCPGDLMFQGHLYFCVTGLQNCGGLPRGS